MDVTTSSPTCTALDMAQPTPETNTPIPSISPDNSTTPVSRRPNHTAEEFPQGVPRRRRSPSRLELRTAFRNFSGVAEVLVGGDAGQRNRSQTKFLVHKELLVAASPFFAAALTGTFAEGLEQCIRLPEEKPEIFEWFLQWLYTGALSLPSGQSNLITDSLAGESLLNMSSLRTDASTHVHQLKELLVGADGGLRNSVGSPKYFLLIELWALSDRLLTTQLSNHVLDTIARLSHSSNSVPTPSDTFMLYDTVRDSSPLRTLVLDLFAYKKTDKLLETHKDEWHPRFLRDLVVKLKRPGIEAIERHDLVAWRPRSWSTTKACEGCKEALKPGLSYDRCAVCAKAFCGSCLRTCGEPNGFTDTSGCKPWMGKSKCLRYHEHNDGEGCS